MSAAPWWQTAVIYQVFVRSFQDASADGNGDLPGLVQRLDYLADLGSDAIWLTPIFDSPWRDEGYDVADYERVHPAYGSLADFDRLVASARGRGIRVILDWVPNHTSDCHRWFRDAARSRDSVRRDWYVWSDPAPDGGPPNNWLSVFGGSAWTLHRASGQYYFHAFLPQQPDLNLRNPEVRAALADNLRYWLRRGAAGIRIDAADMLLEDKLLRDNPPNPHFHRTDAPDNAVIQEQTRDQRGNHRILAELRRICDEFDGRVLLGESYLPLEKLVTYYGQPAAPELHLPLNLRLLHSPWQADPIQQLIDGYCRLLPAGAWPCWSLGNHDIRRLASRVPAGQERVAAMLLLTLRGTPTLYYGDEIGMRDAPIPARAAHDPQTRSWPGHSRDPARTPMQWDASEGAGFTRGRPWLPIGPDLSTCNVAAQRSDPHSLWSLYRDLIVLRRQMPALRHGDQVAVPRHQPIVAYERRDESSGQRLLVALNVSDRPATFATPASGKLIQSTQFERRGELFANEIALVGNEGVILTLKAMTED